MLYQQSANLVFEPQLFPSHAYSQRARNPKSFVMIRAFNKVTPLEFVPPTHHP